ncbi:M4 family metallopeptidase [Longispora albida]|uniref:M4 family metallopeptidase n=1 Tax=Longispora albida TaxID=203523 RepID=UPI000A047E6C|nr:M4 family metallopeptidase [Longispora albida]
MANATPDVPSSSLAIDRANASIAANLTAIRGGSGDAYAVNRTIVDKNTGASHVRYTRTYHGLEVLGGDFVVHNAPGGSFRSATVGLAAPLTLSTTPQLSLASATTAAQKHFQGKIDATGEGKLVVDAVDGPGVLAYEVEVRGMKPDGQTPSVLHVVVDASTGSVRSAHDEIKHAAGTGNTMYAGSVPVETTGSGPYELKDPTRGNGYTCDMNNGTSTCSNMTDADNVWGNGLPANDQTAAADAHYGASLTYDYFKNVHGRNGIFGNGAGVPSRVHYGNAYVNAFWDGSRMTYGDGSGNSKPLTSIDVAGHEMGHGITENIIPGGLTYSGESGGLNESASDIWGNMVEFYAGNTNDPGDYNVGEKIDIRGNGTPLRYMWDPKRDGSSKNCWYSGIGSIDVHYSSGVGNLAFFLLAEGNDSTEWGAATTCNGSTLAGIGRDKASKIWYRAMDVYFTSSTKYVSAGNTNDSRAATLSAATDLYGLCSAEYKAVQAAWTGVTVAGEDATCGGPTTGPTTTTTPPTTTPPGCGAVTNGTDVTIPDNTTVYSNVTVSGCAGNGSTTSKVAVTILHTWRGDLVISLVAPDGTTYLLEDIANNDSADNVIKTYTVNLSSEARNGTWRLKVQDVASLDTGRIDTWTLTV